MKDLLALTDEPTYLLRGADLLSGGEELPRTSVLVAGGQIRALGEPAERAARRGAVLRADLGGHYLSAGFIDLHTHGAAGVDFASAREGDLAGVVRHYLAHGVTSLLMSLYPGTERRTLAAVERAAGWVRSRQGFGVPIGVHLEGPHLNPRRPGALPGRHFRPCRSAELGALLRVAGGALKTMTIAPELPGSRRLIATLRKHRVIPSFGHSDASYEETRTALKQGVRSATHLFNAMRGIHHREPGAVTALLEDPRVTVELIADGFHVHLPLIRLVHQLKSRQRVVLVSDSVAPCGCPPGTYSFAGKPVELCDGRVTLQDGTLAGSALTLDRAVAFHVRQLGFSPAEATRLVTQNPARLLGQRRRGTIAPGKRADLVLLDRRLRVRATWVGGRRLWP